MTIVKLQAHEVPSQAATRLRQATLLGSIEFASLWESVGGRAVCWAVERGGEMRALLAGVEFGRAPFTRFQAMPDGCYCRSLILDRETDIETSAAAILKAVAGAGYARVYLNDYYDLFQPDDSWRSEEARTVLVDVRAEGWKPPDKKLQSEIRKAEREGVILQAFDSSRHFDPFMALMKNTERRHGRSAKYPEPFFRALADLAASDSRVRWILVEHEGKAAASHIYFVEGSLLLNWQVYFDKDYSFLKPNQFITWKVATEEAARGVKYLNLGASPSAAADLVAYKMKWGGRDLTYRCLRKNSWLGRFF